MVISGCEFRASVPKLHPNLIEASEGDDIVVSWQGDGRLLTNLETREANKHDGRPKKRSVGQSEDMFGKSKHFSLNTVDLPRERELETLSPPSDADAPNPVKVANILPPGQKCTYTVMTGCKSRASVPKMHLGNSSQKCTYGVTTGCKSRASVQKMYSGNSSQNCTYTVRSGCESRTSVPKIHPKNIFGSSSQNQLIEASTNYWPNDLLGTISLILKFQCPRPSKSEFQFQLRQPRIFVS